MTATRPTTPTQLLSVASLLGRGEHDVEIDVRGDSMRPTLEPGAAARVRTGRGGPRTPGTVIAFLGGDAVVPHRIVRRGAGPLARRFVVTRGDGCLLCDPPLALDSVVGTVVARRDGHAWVPVPDAPRGAPLRALAVRLLALPVVAALEVHPRLARSCARAMLSAARVVAVALRRPMHSW